MQRQRDTKITSKEHRDNPSSDCMTPLQELWEWCSQIKTTGNNNWWEKACHGGWGWGCLSASPKMMGRNGYTKLTHCKLHFKKKGKQKKRCFIYLPNEAHILIEDAKNCGQCTHHQEVVFYQWGGGPVPGSAHLTRGYVDEWRLEAKEISPKLGVLGKDETRSLKKHRRYMYIYYIHT